MDARERNTIALLCCIQTELDVPKGNYSSYGEYHYRSCEDITKALKPHLAKADAITVLSTKVIEIGGQNYVEATARFICPDGEISNTAYARETMEKKKFDSSQLTGSASSYAQKYALQGLYLIDNDEDDSDATNDHGLSATYVGKLKDLMENYGKKVLRITMGDYKIEKLTDLPENEFDNFVKLLKGLTASETEQAL